jgi:hypothetical protein
MNGAEPNIRPLSGRSLLQRLIVAHLLLLVVLAVTLRFEAPAWISMPLLIAAIALTLVAAICAGRTAADTFAAMSVRKRPKIPPRDVGMLTLVAMGALTWAVARWVYPQSWPTNVNDAVAAAYASLDEDTIRAMSHMNYAELAGMQNTLGATLRARFGLTRHNTTLLHACDPDYRSARSCSMLILSRVWRQIRAQMPEQERAALEQIELSMERVRLKSEKFNDIPLRELVDYFNREIRAQNEPGSQFELVADAAAAEQRLSVWWYAMGTISLREALEVLVEDGQWELRKEPPRLVIQRRATSEPLATAARLRNLIDDA